MPPRMTVNGIEAFHDLVNASAHRSGLCRAIVIAVLAAGSVLISTWAWAHEVRGRHDIAVDYSDWRSAEGDDCCSNQHRRPVPYRFDPTSRQEQIKIGHQWVPVDRSRVLERVAPDGGAHACVIGKDVRCIVLPSIGS